MFLLLLFSLCFCIFHDLIKDIISTLTHIHTQGFAIQGVPKSDDQRDQPQGCSHHPRLPRLWRVIKQKLDPILPMAGGVVVVVVAWKQLRQHRNIIENLCICICLVLCIYFVMLWGIEGRRGLPLVGLT